MTASSHLLDNRTGGVGESITSRNEVVTYMLRLRGEGFMNAGQNAVRNRLAITFAVSKHLLKMAPGVFLATFLSSSAFAQYGGGGTGMGTGTPGTPGYVAPKSGYGSGKAVGIGVGAAAGVGVLFLALHRRGGVTGCVRQSDDGLRLVDEKKNKSYSLEPGSVDVRAGERVQLKGKKSSGTAGAEMFQPTKVVKNLGSCGAEAAH